MKRSRTINVHIRPYSSGDLASITELFRKTVHAVGIGHYTQRELDAWAPVDLPVEAWEKRMAENTSLVAEKDGMIAGFAELSPNGVVDMMYVHKDHLRRGVASALLAELELSADGRGIERLTTNASRAAKQFFLDRAFTVLARQTVTRGSVLIENFQMAKKLPQVSSPAILCP